MNCKFTNVLLFAAGAAIGSAVTWRVLKTKYDRLIQEEIASINEVFGANESDIQNDCNDCTEDDESDTYEDSRIKQIRWEDLEDLDKDELEDPDPETVAEYENLANNYTSEKGGAEDMSDKPYVIAPYDFGELDGYSQFELTYYADGVLEDEDYNIVTDIEELIGSDSLFTFGEYEEDAVFVRNERLKADFQILKEYRTYKEARSAGPNTVDNE